MKVLILRKMGAGVTRGAGEFARLKAVANVLAENDEVAIGEAHPVTLPGLRPFIAACLRVPLIRRSIAALGLKHPLLRTCLRHIELPEGFQPDVVLTTLAPRIAPGALVAAMYSTRWVHLGYVPRFWDYLYSCKVLSASNRPRRAGERNTIRLDTLPTGARKKTSVSSENKAGLVATLTIGANVKHLGYYYKKEDFDILFRGIQNLSSRNNLVWNITTSPRTPAEVEIYLEQLVTELNIPTQKVTWYRRFPEKSLLDMLSKSDLALVTEDSRSMMSDAVASGVPVFSIRPNVEKSIKPGHNNFMSYLEDRHFIKRITFKDVCDLDVVKELNSYFQVIDQCWTEKFKNEIAPMLQAKPRLA